MSNIKKIGVILVLLVLFSFISLAELQPGKLFINNVEIPYTSKTDLEIYLYPRLNGINNDFMIYTKSKDEPINQKIFAFVYDNNQNKIKTMELFNDGRTVGYGNFFKMDNIGTFTVKLCIGSSEESCNELSESVTFEVGDFNCKSLFEEHNNINADRMNMILLGHGYENEEILKKLSQKILTFDGNPILTNMYDKKTNEFVDKQLRWGLFSIEPFKSNKNKFNIWYSLIEEPVQDFLEKIKDGEGGYNLCGLKYPYIAVLDQEVFGMIADYPNFYDSPKINKEDISFGISFNSYDVISDSNLHPSGRFVYYEEVGEQINDIITYTTFSLLPHETGHALIGLRDEFETGGFRHTYPHCAKDINEAKEWWGDLIGQIDPFYYDYIRIMKENRVNIPRGYNEQELGNYLTVGYYLGGCGIDYGNSGAVRPTYTSMMDDATIPIFGSVNSARIEQVLNLFSGEETPPKEPKQISYVYANGQRIAKIENNEVYYFHNDHLGSPAAITNSKGEVVWQGDYKPFGESFNEVSFDGNNVKYNSKELDKDTELHYYGARYYNAPNGRFITADTVKGSLVDPQSLNLYVYTRNNPMKYVDPTGNEIRLGSSGNSVTKSTDTTPISLNLGINYVGEFARQNLQFLEKEPYFQYMQEYIKNQGVIVELGILLSSLIPSQRVFSEGGHVVYDENNPKKILIEFALDKLSLRNIGYHELSHLNHYIRSGFKLEKGYKHFVEEIATDYETLNYLSKNQGTEEEIFSELSYLRMNVGAYYVIKYGIKGEPESGTAYTYTKNKVIKGYPVFEPNRKKDTEDIQVDTLLKLARIKYGETEDRYFDRSFKK